MFVCIEMLCPSMSEENILIEISPNEGCQIMFFCDGLRTLTEVSTEYIRTSDSLLLLPCLDKQW